MLIIVTVTNPTDVQMLHQTEDNDNVTNVTCTSNYHYPNNYQIIDPKGDPITDLNCNDGECNKTISQPLSGKYYCELELDGLHIASQKEAIIYTEDVPPLQPTTVTTQLVTIEDHTSTTKLTNTSIGLIVVVVVLLLALTLISVVSLLNRYRNELQDAYQQLLGINDPGTIQLYTNFVYHMQGWKFLPGENFCLFFLSPAHMGEFFIYNFFLVCVYSYSLWRPLPCTWVKL